MPPQKSIYRQLQEHFDNMPVGFPKSPTGLDIKLLQYLFSPAEAQIALELNALPEPLSKIHKRLKKTGLSVADLETTLDGLVEKGAIMDSRSPKTGEKRYGKAMPAIGMFEFQAGQLTKAFADIFDAYAKESFYKEFFTKKTSQMRTIPVNRSITPANRVATYDDVKDIVIKTERDIAVMYCVCREAKDLMATPCKRTDIRETCLMFNDAAELMVNRNRGRRINKTEALNILTMAEECGLVLQPSNNQQPHFICCCCACCCEALDGMKRFPKPAEYCHSNFQAAITPDHCNGCKQCVRVCPMEALSIRKKKARIDLDRCIGCGVCVSKCKPRALQLKQKDEVYVPPKTIEGLYNKIFYERVGISGMVKLAPKLVFGKKI